MRIKNRKSLWLKAHINLPSILTPVSTVDRKIIINGVIISESLDIYIWIFRVASIARNKSTD